LVSLIEFLRYHLGRFEQSARNGGSCTASSKDVEALHIASETSTHSHHFRWPPEFRRIGCEMDSPVAIASNIDGKCLPDSIASVRWMQKNVRRMINLAHFSGVTNPAAPRSSILSLHANSSTRASIGPSRHVRVAFG